MRAEPAEFIPVVLSSTPCLLAALTHPRPSGSMHIGMMPSISTMRADLEVQKELQGECGQNQRPAGARERRVSRGRAASDPAACAGDMLLAPRPQLRTAPATRAGALPRRSPRRGTTPDRRTAGRLRAGAPPRERHPPSVHESRRSHAAGSRARMPRSVHRISGEQERDLRLSCRLSREPPLIGTRTFETKSGSSGKSTATPCGHNLPVARVSLP